MKYICGFICEATWSDYQMFKVDCNDDHNLNNFDSLTIVNCGMRNQGNSAFGICGTAHYRIINVNSSYNFNFVNQKSYGTCFRTFNIKGYDASYINFAHSSGHDIINTHFYSNTADMIGKFSFGNIYNCTTDFIFQYRGINRIENSHLYLLTPNAFKCGASNTGYHSLTIVNCIFDYMPTVQYPCTLENCKDNNINPTTMAIGHIGLGSCPIPSNYFTQSQFFTLSYIFSISEKFTPSNFFSPSIFFSSSSKFTSSDLFSASSKFTPSNYFAPSLQFTSSIIFSASSEFTSSKKFTISSQFTSSEKFSPSSDFTSSDNFSPSSEFTDSKSLYRITDSFTPSNHFTPSFTFSPNATKYPDGRENYKRADIAGRSKLDQPASAAAVGATAGISIVLIVVSVILMVLYLRSKQRQLKRNIDDLSEDFLYDSSDNYSDSYSYSYYTYDYTYETVCDSNYEYPYSYYEYSDLDHSYESFTSN